MVQIAERLAAALNKKSLRFNEAVCSVTYRALCKGYSFANCVWLGKQIAHETGWGTSNSIEVDRNAWGMNCVSTRETTQIGCRQATPNEALGQYHSVDSSCADRLLWDDYWGISAHKRDNTYPAHVSAKYHTSDGYIHAVDAVNAGPVRTAVLTAILLVPMEVFMLFQLLKFFKK